MTSSAELFFIRAIYLFSKKVIRKGQTDLKLNFCCSSEQIWELAGLRNILMSRTGLSFFVVEVSIFSAAPFSFFQRFNYLVITEKNEHNVSS